MRRRQLILAGTTSIPVLVLSSACGKKEEIPHAKSIINRELIQLASAILELMGLITISFKFHRFFKISWAFGTGQVSFEGKGDHGKFESSAKLPLFKFPVDGTKEALLEYLQAMYDRQGKTKKVVDDGSILLFLHDGRGHAAPIPITDANPRLCCFSPGASITSIEIKDQTTTINVYAISSDSFLTVGPCNILMAGSTVELRLDDDAPIGKYGKFQGFDLKSQTWENLGQCPMVTYQFPGEQFRVRIIDAGDIVWDGSFDRTDLVSGCRNYRLDIVYFEGHLDARRLVCLI